MRYYNINNKQQEITFREAVIRGISSDMGLFMPVGIPRMSHDFFKRLPSLELPEIALEVAKEYIGDEIDHRELKKMCDEAFNFPVVMKQLDERKHVLELFHGPTAAFKDFGARFMSQCFRYFSASGQAHTVVLVATSGDTGGAIANSFLGIDTVDVIILYPSGKVSDLQEQQLTTLGQNITALEVEGTFDDCQAMVKRAFTQLETKGRIALTSANSINVARLIPQSFYYYYAATRSGMKAPVISVPSGNFGNITGAMMAWKSGLPVKHFVASTNINKVVPDYLESGAFSPRPSVLTLANAMDVGNPSNFYRLTEIFDNDLAKVKDMVAGYWFDDNDIINHIAEEYKRSGYLLDPHGAVASMGLDRYLEEESNATGIFVATAHPAKFMEVVRRATGREAEMPACLQQCLSGTKESVPMKADYSSFEEYLRSRYGL